LFSCASTQKGTTLKERQLLRQPNVAVLTAAPVADAQLGQVDLPFAAEIAEDVAAQPAVVLHVPQSVTGDTGHLPCG